MKYISVSDISILGGNSQDIINTIRLFDKLGVMLKLDNLGSESQINRKKNPTFDLIASVMINLSFMERDALLERQKERIAISKGKEIIKFLLGVLLNPKKKNY